MNLSNVESQRGLMTSAESALYRDAECTESFDFSDPDSKLKLKHYLCQLLLFKIKDNIKYLYN